MGTGRTGRKNPHARTSASQDWSRSWVSNGDTNTLGDDDDPRGFMPNTPDTTIYHVGIYGWRKKCLYCLVMLIMAMLIVNIALTVWIIRVLDFSVGGMGKLRVTEAGLRLEGESEFLHSLWASEVHSRKDKPLKLESANNITLNARNTRGLITNQLYMGSSLLESMADRFTVKNSRGDVLFEATDDQVSVHSKTLRITAPGGVRFSGSVQTPLIRTEPFEQLRLESPTRSLRISAPEGVSLESRAGDISLTCMKNFDVKSREGVISLDSEVIELRNLKEALPTTRGNTYKGIYQICACQNGRLFVVAPEAVCEASKETCETTPLQKRSNSPTT